MSEKKALMEAWRQKAMQKDSVIAEQERQIMELNQNMLGHYQRAQEAESKVLRLEQQVQSLYTQLNTMTVSPEAMQKAYSEGHRRGYEEMQEAARNGVDNYLLPKHQQEMKEAEQTIATLQREITHLRTKLYEQDKNFAEQIETISRTCRDISTTTQNQAKLQESYDQNLLQRQRAEADCQTLQQRLAESDKSVASNLQELEKVQLELANTQQQLHTRNSKYQLQQKKLQERTEKLDQLRSRCHELENELAGMQRDAARAKRAVPEVSDDSPPIKRVRPLPDSQLVERSDQQSSSSRVVNTGYAFARKYSALREAFLLYSVISASGNANTRSKSLFDTSLEQVSWGDGSWFEVGVETITTRPPADALSISREALFDDCLEKVGRKALNRSAKFISVTFTHTGLSTSQKSKKRKENATDEGGLTSELFTLFFEGLSETGVRIDQNLATLLRLESNQFALFQPASKPRGYLFPAIIQSATPKNLQLQVIPQTAQFRGSNPTERRLYESISVRGFLNGLWDRFERIGRVYNQAIRQGHPIPELLLHPLLFQFLIHSTDRPFETISESAGTVASWIEEFDDNYRWFAKGVLNEDFQQMMNTLEGAQIPTAQRISLPEFQTLSSYQQDAKRKSWLFYFVEKRIYQPRIGALTALKHGFHQVPIASHLSIFSWDEIRQIAVGVEAVSAEQLLNIVEWHGSEEFQEAMTESLQALSDEESRNLLFYCTASRIIHERSVLQIVELTGHDPSGAYPTAMTCFAQLKVPFCPGTSSSVLLQGVRRSLQSNEAQKYEYDEGFVS